jgi:cytochrome c oxidase assembly protein subunit 15
MVDWHLFKEFPPLTNESWTAEFEKYQQFPEFQQANSHMTVSEFKRIWWMEYLHRMMGRTVGAAFVVPAAIFWYKGWLVKGMRMRVPLIGGLILTQGLIGWWMVKSGLTEENAAKYSDPQVSHYRLATHLSTAFILYSVMIWSSLSHLLPPEQRPVTANLIRLKKLAMTSKSLIFLTAVSGAFVAGLDAGLIYNTYPKMGNSLIPSDLLAESPIWKNFVENPTTTQFDHRLLGHVTAASVIMTWAYSRKVSSPRLRLLSTILLVAVMGQVGLGISTLLAAVPKSLASAHQASALALLTSALVLSHEMKLVKRIPK